MNSVAPSLWIPPRPPNGHHLAVITGGAIAGNAVTTPSMEAARFAVEEVNRHPAETVPRVGALELIEVLSSSRQVVRGTTFTLKLLVEDEGEQRAKVKATVYVPVIGSTTLLDFRLIPEFADADQVPEESAVSASQAYEQITLLLKLHKDEVQKLKTPGEGVPPISFMDAGGYEKAGDSRPMNLLIILFETSRTIVANWMLDMVSFWGGDGGGGMFSE
ncbi:hypothetical protein BSKO_04041 [Bryopsis sp. KO-2023]|nr:hypothetical protein BSKO_04041 [Bryopsis sp. KO-2023]